MRRCNIRGAAEKEELFKKNTKKQDTRNTSNFRNKIDGNRNAQNKKWANAVIGKYSKGISRSGIFTA